VTFLPLLVQVNKQIFINITSYSMVNIHDIKLHSVIHKIAWPIRDTFFLLTFTCQTENSEII
jgi:hypothetical protein